MWAAAKDLPEELERVIQLQLRRQEDTAEALENEQPRAGLLGLKLLEEGVADEAHPVCRAYPRARASTKRAMWGRSQEDHCGDTARRERGTTHTKMQMAKAQIWRCTTLGRTAACTVTAPTRSPWHTV